MIVGAMWQIFRMNDVYYFHDLIKQLTDWGYQEGTTLFGFGYDFRQSNRCSFYRDVLFNSSILIRVFGFCLL